jgi:hypothetical protein
LETIKNGTVIDIKGVYVKGKAVSFLRIFNDSGLYFIPLEDSLNHSSETSVIELKGKVEKNGVSYLAVIEVKSYEGVEKIKDVIEREYPFLIDKIKDEIHTPKSKLDLKEIESWHIACSENNIFIYGRTYDLMYEFNVGVLVEKSGDTYSLRRIYAREFFKGE